MYRIGLDARMVSTVPSGLGTYAANLARALISLDRANQYVIIRGPDSPLRFDADDKAGNVEEAVLPGELDTPRNLLQGHAISQLRLDLYHSLHHFLPLALDVPRVVVTLHDLIWIEHAALSRPDRIGALANHLFARATMGRALRRADRIIAVSGHTRARALNYYGLDASSIQVVHHGVDLERLRDVPHQTHLPHPAYPPHLTPLHTSTAPYFLCLGNTRPYKNIPTALGAFASCARRRSEVQLIVAGRGDSFGALETLARNLGVADRVQLVGPVEDDGVAQLLHHAVALVFPSLVEGFGFPVLEAMAAGCAVIASRCPAVVEIANSAAVLCDATDVDQFAAAMTNLLDDETLREDLRRRGRERAKQFSWQKCAAETLAVYRQLLR